MTGFPPLEPRQAVADPADELRHYFKTFDHNTDPHRKLFDELVTSVTIRNPKDSGVAGSVHAYSPDGRRVVIIAADTSPEAFDGVRQLFYGPNDSVYPGDWVLLAEDDDEIARWDESADQLIVKKPIAMGTGGSIAAESWTNVSSFSNSWVNYGSPFVPARYKKTPDGTVHVQGLIMSGTLASPAFTLPAGYRPDGTLIIAAACYSSAHGELRIEADGDVIPHAGSNTSFSIHCSFPT